MINFNLNIEFDEQITKIYSQVIQACFILMEEYRGISSE